MIFPGFLFCLIAGWGENPVPAPPTPPAPQAAAAVPVPQAAGACCASAKPADQKPADQKSVVKTEAKPRIDQKKPYMRVWYWPPMPQSSSMALAHVDAGQGVGQAVSGGDPMLPLIDAVNFPTNRSKVVDEMESLRRLAAWMAATPDAKITLEGHADSRGNAKANQRLSERRAQAVKDVLTKMGVDGSRISVKAKGVANPEKGETADESYWLSRRVSIQIQKAIKPEAKPEAKEA